MHSLVLIGFISLLLGLEGIGAGATQLSFMSSVVIAGLGVLLIGVPHGGLDHRIGSDLIASLRDRGIGVEASPTKTTAPSLALFLVTYLGVAVLTVVGWHLVPFWTVLGFFALSAWHFGLEEDERTEGRLWLDPCLIARGGIAIWVPSALRGSEVSELLALTIPLDNGLTAAEIVRAVQWASPWLLLLTLADLIRYRARDAWSHRTRVVAIMILCATIPTILSFTIYFCGWHSIRGLTHLHAAEGKPPLHQFMVSLMPISVAAGVIFLAGLAYWVTRDGIAPAIVRTTFIGISAIAIPHLVLHAASDWVKSRGAIVWTVASTVKTRGQTELAT
jgi:beta-carotene 15,15'-dioxygenase